MASYTSNTAISTVTCELGRHILRGDTLPQAMGWQPYRCLPGSISRRNALLCPAMDHGVCVLVSKQTALGLGGRENVREGPLLQTGVQ